MNARLWPALIALAVTFGLAGCASLNQLSNDVSTYSVWPAERKPASYAFERLPSQQGNPQQQQFLEDAAAPALQHAGFTAAGDPAAADVTVTLGARVYATQISPYDDPFWWRGGLWPHRMFWRPGFGHFGHFGHFGPWSRPFGPWSPWGPSFYTPTYEREVAMLIRDRRTGRPLYEARVTNDGTSPSILSLLSAMFSAGMKDFPAGGPNPRRVVTPIT